MKKVILGLVMAGALMAQESTEVNATLQKEVAEPKVEKVSRREEVAVEPAKVSNGGLFVGALYGMGGATMKASATLGSTTSDGIIDFSETVYGGYVGIKNDAIRVKFQGLNRAMKAEKASLYTNGTLISTQTRPATAKDMFYVTDLEVVGEYVFLDQAGLSVFGGGVIGMQLFSGATNTDGSTATFTDATRPSAGLLYGVTAGAEYLLTNKLSIGFHYALKMGGYGLSQSEQDYAKANNITMSRNTTFSTFYLSVGYAL